MTGSVRSRLAQSWLVPLCAAAGLVVPAGASAAPTPAQCGARVNDTPSKLVECIQTDELWSHMQAFQAIADANPGLDGHPSRNSGEPGYRASVDYVADKMRKAGYDVTIQPYKFTYSSFIGTPTWSESTPTPHNFELVTDWNPGTSNGTADADMQPAGGIVLPPTPTSSSTSGCTAADFNGFTAGRDRADPARRLQLRGKGAQRAGRGRDGCGHLQRGQPWAHCRDQRQPAGRQQQPVRPDDPGGVHVVRYRQHPPHGVPGRDAAAHEPRHSRRSSIRTATTGT